MLKIDMGELVDAFDSSGYERSYFLDLETGKLELLIPDAVDDIEKEEMEYKIDSNPGRYERVPSIESHEAYQIMVDFADTVADSNLHDLLSVALNGSGAFRRFKDVLAPFPEERKRWFDFKYRRMKDNVDEWLQDIGVEALEEKQSEVSEKV
ncbi:MAG: UPF0158 family protein [Thaumarchaeota archaeon]|nr:UPF0158 family protein [Nitrososphaerota archaeon]